MCCCRGASRGSGGPPGAVCGSFMSRCLKGRNFILFNSSAGSMQNRNRGSNFILNDGAGSCPPEHQRRGRSSCELDRKCVRELPVRSTLAANLMMLQLKPDTFKNSCLERQKIRKLLLEPAGSDRI